MSHLEFEQLAVGQALGALEPDDEQRFAAHLQGCSFCQRDLLELHATVQELAVLAPVTASPRSLHATLRSRIGLHPSRGLRRQRPRRRRAVARRVLAALLAAFIVGLIFWNTGLRIQTALDQRRLSGFENAVTTLNATDSQITRLRPGAGMPSEARATAATRPDGTSGVFVVDGLPQLPAERSYQLWAVPPEATSTEAVPGPRISSAGTVSAVPFDFTGRLPDRSQRTGDSPAPTPDGSAPDGSAPDDAAPGYLYLVTVEPQDGSDAPTLPPVLVSAAT